MRGYGRDYRYEWGYPTGRAARGAPGYDAGYRRASGPSFEWERPHARPRRPAPPVGRGYSRDFHAGDYNRGGERAPRGYHPPRYEREYSRAYRDLFCNPRGTEMGGMDLAYRETQGRTGPYGIGDGGIGGAGTLGTGGGYFHI